MTTGSSVRTRVRRPPARRRRAGRPPVTSLSRLLDTPCAGGRARHRIVVGERLLSERGRGPVSPSLASVAQTAGRSAQCGVARRRAGETRAGAGEWVRDDPRRPDAAAARPRAPVDILGVRTTRAGAGRGVRLAVPERGSAGGPALPSATLAARPHDLV